MLTLREPIKLNISDGLCTVSDAFYERIAGTYGVMQADVTPKELLFCLSTPFELPDELGGMTTVAIANNYSDRRSVTMALVTNVLNRILLSTTPQFTYQDQVYIDSVLYRLGIEDVPLFMKQVQKLSEEHLSVERLVSLYRQELSLRGSQTTESENAEPRQAEQYGTAAGAPERERLYLHNAIYDRLQTRELYELVNSLQNDSTHSFSSFRQNELKTAEQLSVSRLLELSELRERTAEIPRANLYHTVNRFELGDLLPAPQTAEQVLSQASEAALLASFEHIFTQRLADRLLQTNVWLRLEQALSETVENSVSRFQSFHAENSFFFSESIEAPGTADRLREESRVLRQLLERRTALNSVLELTRRLRESESIPPASLVNPPVEAEGDLIREDRETERTETIIEKSSTRNIAELTKNIFERGAAPAPVAPAHPAGAVPAELHYRTVREIELRGEVERETEHLRETLLLQRAPAEEIAGAQTTETETKTVSETLRELRERSEQSTVQTRTQEILRQTALQNPAAAAETAATDLVPAPATSAEAGTEGKRANPETLSGETSAALLERELRETDEKNRERFETLQIEHLHTVEKQPPVPDTKKTIEISKRALDAPETVLRELRESAAKENGAPGLSAEAEMYLRHADPATRAVLEAALRRESDGASGGNVPGFREGTPGEFNAAAMEILRGNTPEAQPASPAVRETAFTESTKTLLKTVSEPAAGTAQQRPAAPLPKLSLVHRREQEFLSDELLERLENHSTKTSEQTDVFETQTDRRIEEFNRTGTTTHLTTQTAEDVTELVNRTLARQMNEISDKVYRQMEKRLQTERSRRGRF